LFALARRGYELGLAELSPVQPVRVAERQAVAGPGARGYPVVFQSAARRRALLGEHAFAVSRGRIRAGLAAWAEFRADSRDRAARADRPAREGPVSRAAVARARRLPDRQLPVGPRQLDGR